MKRIVSVMLCGLMMFSMTACAAGGAGKPFTTTGTPSSGETDAGVMFSMEGYSGKYIRIGVYRGGMINTNTTGLQQINTREIVVFGSRKPS